MSLNKVLVFTESENNISSFCSYASSMADNVTDVVLGLKESAVAAAAYADRVLWLGQKPDNVIIEAYTSSLEEIIAEEEPQLVLMDTTMSSRCIAGKLAIRLNAPVFSDASAIEICSSQVKLSRSVYGGSAIMTASATDEIIIALIGSGSSELIEKANRAVVVEKTVDPEINGITLISSVAKQTHSVNLSSAKTIIGIGRGMASPEKYQVATDLAKKAGAEMICTRPISEEEGLMPTERYAGVSGISVKPDVYLALGISGQVQHMVGVNNSKTIFAVNKDKAAAIFKQCDYGIVEDVEKLVPYLIKNL